jgi:hypothetical protein
MFVLTISIGFALPSWGHWLALSGTVATSNVLIHFPGFRSPATTERIFCLKRKYLIPA